MRAPAFWWQTPPTLLARAMAPAGLVYGAVTAARMRRAGAQAGVPVLCVGNLVAGGAGKTPTAIALAEHLLAEGRRPAFVTRGYGRTASADACFEVDPARHDAAQAGDEPLLLARIAPTFVARDRRTAARAAVVAGADCIVLDDGLQNPSLFKGWSVAVVDGASGVGNGLCVPAGPLRAPVARQWPFVSLVCVVGAGAAGDALARMAEAAAVPVTRARLAPDPAVLARWRGRRLIAVAGIGRPEKFFETLRAAGLAPAATHAFPDHHRYSPGELDTLARSAVGAVLVTTAKDRVRMPPDFQAEALPVRLVYDDPARFRASLPF